MTTTRSDDDAWHSLMKDHLRDLDRTSNENSFTIDDILNIVNDGRYHIETQPATFSFISTLGLHQNYFKCLKETLTI